MPQVRRGRPTKARELWLAKDPFLKALQDACHLAHDAQRLNPGERERQVEDTFFRAAVALEAFLTDWIARCLHFNTSRLGTRARDTAESHLAQQIASGWSPDDQTLKRTIAQYPAAVDVRMDIPKTIAVNKARQLLGVEDSNRSFAGAAAFKEWAGRYLADPKARATTQLDAADDAVLDATIAIRNVIAHRSRRSEEQLNRALRSAQLPSALRVNRKVTAAGIGRYLRVEKAGRPRFKHYFDRLANIANKLAPYQGRPRTICPS